MHSSLPRTPLSAPAGDLPASAASLTRRRFVYTSAGAAALAMLPARGLAAASPANRIRIGVMGLGGRGTYLAQSFVQRPDVEIAYLCDCDTRRFGRARAAIQEHQERPPKLEQDFRRVLEDKTVDVLINATPDHWHALGSIMACQAGKDVYVEKPMTHNLWEGRQMVAAARKYGRIVQVGTQSRSASYLRDAAEQIRSGKLGEVHIVKVFNMMQHPRQKKLPEHPVPVPDGFDYDTWCGPAAKLPYSPTRGWLNNWEYSCGAIAGDAVHQLDLARYLVGDPAYPQTVVNAGGILSLDDGRDCPDTQYTMFEYGKLTLVFESALWTPYMKKTALDRRDKGEVPNWPFNATRIEVYGTKGFMYFGRHGDGWQMFNENGDPGPSIPGRQADREHQENFLACVRSRQQPTSNVEQGHYSTVLSHLSNISYRAGNRKLTFDARTESFPGVPEANAFLRRTYRAPWTVPETV